MTCGVGKYTNKNSAEFIAKKNAGVDSLYYDEILTVEKKPFTLCTREEFMGHSHGNKIYMHGTVGFGKQGDKISGCVSCISLPDWGCVSYGMSTSISTNRIKRSMMKEMYYGYELEREGILPHPIELVEHIDCNEDMDYCIFVAAMIVE